MAVVLALLSSLAWGTADFLGGTASRRLDPLVVVCWAEASGLLLVVPVAAATGSFGAGTGYLGWALVGGVIGVGSLVVFFVALAAGTMGVVAPLVAVSVVVPIAVGIAQGDSPSAVQLAGLAVAASGVVLASGPDLRGSHPGAGSRRARPVVLALCAAAGFGVALVCIAKGSGHNVWMTLVIMRAVSVVTVAAMLYARRASLRLPRAGVPIVAGSGAFDASANVLYGVASTMGLISVVAVLSSLYPAVTVLLARGIHGERLRRVQAVGVVVVLAGVAFIAGG